MSDADALSTAGLVARELEASAHRRFSLNVLVFAVCATVLIAGAWSPDLRTWASVAAVFAIAGITAWVGALAHSELLVDAIAHPPYLYIRGSHLFVRSCAIRCIWLPLLLSGGIAAAMTAGFRPDGVALVAASPFVAVLGLGPLSDSLVWQIHGRPRIERECNANVEELMLSRGYRWHWWHGWTHGGAHDPGEPGAE